jgi:nucleoside-diphosphate-sugar epimerase
MKGMRSAVRSEEPRTVLVTGATGFIGLNVLHELIGDGHEVLGVASGPLPQLAAASLDRTGAIPVVEEIDIRDGTSVHDVVARFRPDVVIHAAAVTAGAERERTDARTIIDVNIGGTQSVLDACLRNDVGRMVHVSSGAVYGAATFGTDTLDETTRVEPVGLYGITKLAAEQLVRRHAELHDTDIVIGRLSAVFGPWEYPTGVRDFMSPMLQVVRASRNGEMSRYVEDAPRNWVYAPDAAQALIGLALCPTPRFDCYNVCPEERGSLAQHIERLRAFAPDADLRSVRGPADASVSYDADPRLDRAPVSGGRIQSELGDDLWSPHDDAFDSYLTWVDSNPDWL